MLHLHFIYHDHYSSSLSPITEHPNFERLFCLLSIIIKSRNKCTWSNYLNILKTETIKFLHSIVELVSSEKTQLHMLWSKFYKQNRYIICWNKFKEFHHMGYIYIKAKWIKMAQMRCLGISKMPQHRSCCESMEPDSQAAPVVTALM